MAIKLSDKPNVQAPSGSYNYGKIQNNDGSNNGTPVNTLVYSDLHLFFEKLMEAGGVVHNGLYDSDDDGYQLYQAFQKASRRELKSLLGILAETMIGDDTSPISAISPCSLLGVEWNSTLTILSAGYVYYNEELFFCGGYTGAIIDTAVFTKTADNILQVTDAVSGSGDFDYADLIFVQGKWRTYAPSLTANDGASIIPGGFIATVNASWMFKNNVLHIRMRVTAVETLNTVKYLGFSLPMAVASPYNAEGFNLCKYFDGASYTVKQVKIGLRHTGSGTGLEVSNFDSSFFATATGGTIDFEITIGYRKDNE